MKRALDEAELALQQTLARAAERLVIDASERVAAAQAARNTWRTLMLFRIYRILTPRQRSQLAAFHETRERGRGESPAK